METAFLLSLKCSWNISFKKGTIALIQSENNQFIIRSEQFGCQPFIDCLNSAHHVHILHMFWNGNFAIM